MIEVVAPVSGLACPLSEVPDPVFSQSMVGPGLALKPHGDHAEALAPVAGTVATSHPHAFVISSFEGVAILVHLGIDTVKLEGAGFTLLMSRGDVVEAGQKLVEWSPSEVESHGYSSVCPVIALDVTAEALGDVREDGHVIAGDAVFTVGA